MPEPSGAGNDEDALFVHEGYEVGELLEGSAEVFAGDAGWGLEAASAEATFGGGWEGSGVRGVGGGQVAVFGNEEAFGDDKGGVGLDVFLGHGGEEGVHGLGVEVYVFHVAAGAVEAVDAVGSVDDVVGHGFHGYEVDVGDLVVPGGDGLRGAHAGGDVTVDVEAEFVGFGGCGGDPCGGIGAVELDAGEAVGLGLVDGGDGLRDGGDDGAELGGVGAFAVDEVGGEDVGHEELSGGAAVAAGDGVRVVVAGVAGGGDAEGEQEGSGGVVSDVHVGIPEAGDEGFSGALEDLCSGGNGCGGGGADGL